MPAGGVGVRFADTHLEWPLGQSGFVVRSPASASNMNLTEITDRRQKVVLPQIPRPISQRSKRAAARRMLAQRILHYHLRKTASEGNKQPELASDTEDDEHEPAIRPVTSTLHPSKPHTQPGTLRSDRCAMPFETMLPHLRAGFSRPFIPRQGLILQSGLESLINRGFLPHDADYSGLISLERGAGRDCKSVDTYLRPTARQPQRDSGWSVPVTAIRAADAQTPSDADIQAEHHVDRKHYGGKRVLTTSAVAAHWYYVHNAHNVIVLPPKELVTPRALEVTMTPVQSVIASSVDEDNAGPDRRDSDFDMFQFEAQRAMTARLIAASRDGPLIPISQGSVSRHAPAFLQYRKSCGESWEAADRIVKIFEEFMQNYAVPYAELISREVSILAAAPIKPRLTRSEILSCIANAADVQQLISTPGQRYRGRDGLNAAAAKIQGTFRMWIMRRIQFWHLRRVAAVGVFIKFWKVKMMRRNVQKQVRSQYLKVHLRRYHRLLHTLKEELGGFLAHKRIVIQLVPARMMTERNNMTHDYSVGRLHMLTDPLVETIFVTPTEDEDRREYFRTMMATSFPDHNPMDEDRVRFVFPEAAACFPDTAPLATKLLCSRRALSELRSMCMGKSSVIIADVIGEAEVMLSSALGIPLLGPTPEAYAAHLSTRGRARSFLQSCGVPTAPALESRAIDESEMNLHIVKAISMFSEAPLWTLSADPVVTVVNGMEWEGPLAILDPTALTFHKDLFEPPETSPVAQDVPALPRPSSTRTDSTLGAHSKLNVSISTYNRPTTAPPIPVHRPKTARRGMIAAHLQLARREIPQQTKILIPKYQWSELVKDWVAGGGIALGLPKKDAREMRALDVGFEVDLVGKWKFVGIGEMLLNKNTFRPTALVVANVDTSLQHELSPFLDRIAVRAAQRGILGPLTLQLVTWHEAGEPETRCFWATHLRPHLTPALLRAAAVNLATGCKPDPRDWKLKFLRNDIPLHITYAQGARYMDQSRIRTQFHATKIASLSAVESRISIYLYSLEHSQVAVMRQASAASTLLNNGLGFDAWTRTGIIFPEKDSGWSGMFPVICVAESYQKALESAVHNLLQVNVALDECTHECIEQDGSVYRSNFVAVATRLLLELQAIGATSSAKKVHTASRRLSPQIQQAFQELGVTVVKEEVAEPPIALFRGKARFRYGEEDTGSDSDPEIVDPVDSTIRLTHINRAQSAAATAASDLAILVSQFFPVPPIRPREATIAALKRRAHAAELRKARRRAGFSAVTAALLNEGISSDFAATHDDTFNHPPLSPPYSRKASQKMAQSLSGKTKRGRDMLAKLEQDMDERTRRGLMMADTPIYRGKLARSVHIEDAIKDEGSDNEQDEANGQRPMSDQSTDAKGFKAAHHIAATVSLKPKSPPELDVDTVLEKLRDVAERGERLSAFLDERMVTSQKILQEHHKTHLEMLEQHKSDVEAREAQRATLIQRELERNGSATKKERPANYLMQRRSSFPGKERVAGEFADRPVTQN
ncbi:hypothetical protein HDU88_007789 [Geranomyces variabilis]|nr:hypothetical protein HDU88_007789 [Geranomyces variabilis]